MRTALLCMLWMTVATPVAAETFVWVDEDGVTHLTTDPEKVPEDQRQIVDEDVALEDLWDGDRLAPPGQRLTSDSSRPESRTRRQLAGALDDLRQGETARATTTLRRVLEEDPSNAAAHWYLALLERQRGRFTTAAEHLRAFLTHAGPEHERWRASAKERLAAMDDERRLLRRTSAPARFRVVESANFLVRYDTNLARATPDYAGTVVRYLEEAHEHLVRQWGVKREEPTTVVLYGKAAYVRAHAHRFSFDTVGFYDGRIHVVSAAHPEGELRSLLFHEYTHALFRDQTGGDRPYWLNEGLAEMAERTSRQEEILSRGERIRLRDRIRQGRWIALYQLSPSFAGLVGDDARIAYTISTAAAQWLVQRTDSWERARLLAALARGESQDEALKEAVGLDLDGLERALKDSILDEFPSAASIDP